MYDNESYPPHIEQQPVRYHNKAHSLSAEARDQLAHSAQALTMMTIHSAMCKQFIFVGTTYLTDTIYW